jgi:multicomponent Na+:H+ antiporter subunit D
MAGTIHLDRLGGITERAPVFSLSVFVAGITLVGIPPVVGFFGKFLVFWTALQGGAGVVFSLPFGVAVTGTELALGVALGGAVLTIAYFTKMWNRGFWGVPGAAVEDPPSRSLVAVVAFGAILAAAIGVGFDPVVRAAEAAAEAAAETDGYIDAVEPEGFTEEASDKAGALLGVIRP